MKLSKAKKGVLGKIFACIVALSVCVSVLSVAAGAWYLAIESTEYNQTFNGDLLRMFVSRTKWSDISMQGPVTAHIAGIDCGTWEGAGNLGFSYDVYQQCAYFSVVNRISGATLYSSPYHYRYDNYRMSNISKDIPVSQFPANGVVIYCTYNIWTNAGSYVMYGAHVTTD